MNFYNILGLNPGASKKEIIAAYRKKAKEYHPDINGNDPSLKRKFTELHEAYKNLLDNIDLPIGRVRSTFSENLTAVRLNSIKEIKLTLYEAINGIHYKIDDANSVCDTCNGAGHIRLKEPSACPYCDGTGNSAHKKRGALSINIVCTHCEGSGKTMRRKCFECHGFGTKAGRGLIVDLPAGCLVGESFVIENGFSNQENNVKGDLELLIALKSEPGFRVLGKDIEMQVYVDVWDAVLGCGKEIYGPGGNLHKFSIPAGTNHGRRIRLKNMGMRQKTEDIDKGDLIIIVCIKIPNGENPKIKEAFTRLRKDLNSN